MSESLVPYQSRYLASRVTTRGLAQINSATTLAEAQENAAAELALIRIRNGVHLLERTVLGLAAVDGLISTVSHERPGLELSLRCIEQELALGIGATIRGYVQR